MAAAADTFNDSTLPLRGMRTHSSQCCKTPGRIPVPSPPLLHIPENDDDTDPCDFGLFPLVTHETDETENSDV